jgi:hypothetical protein
VSVLSYLRRGPEARPRAVGGPDLQYSNSNRQQALLAAFHGQVYMGNHVDIQKGRLWDCIDFAAGSSLYPAYLRFFENVGPGSGKTILESNVSTPHRLDAPEAFSIRRVLFTFDRRAVEEDVYGIAESCCFSLMLGQKYYLRSPIITLQTTNAPLAPIRHCTYCRAVYVMQEQCPGCGAQEFLLDASGEFEVGRCFFLDLAPEESIVIVNQMSFRVFLDTNAWGYTLKAKLRLWCHLEGLHMRGVV